MKKVLIPLLMLGSVITLTNCKKDAGQILSNNLNAVSPEDVVSSTSSKFGVLVVDRAGDDKITVANELKTSYVRSAIELVDFSGDDKMMDKYNANNFKVLLNLEYTKKASSPRPFPTNMDKYTKLLGNVLDKYHPTMAVIENEPSNEGYYSGPIEDYITELTNAVTVCKHHNVK